MNTIYFVSGNYSELAEVYAVQSTCALASADIAKLEWLFQAQQQGGSVAGTFVGPRREMVSPWSSNVCEIARNIGVLGINRAEYFSAVSPNTPPVCDRMLQAVYHGLDQQTLSIAGQPAPLALVSDIAGFNAELGLALSPEEVEYLQQTAKSLGRSLTDAEIYAFAQINSEHCRHKIFNAQFVLDGEPQEKSLFALIKETSRQAPRQIISAYRDNVAFVAGHQLAHFSPQRGDVPSVYQTNPVQSVLSLKAETHNFPTTVEPFFGASTGTGGEIRDRMAGGMGSIPLAGTAVYMTSYPRLYAASQHGTAVRSWENSLTERNWKYQTPAQILIKASNGASDFGNKFGQPLIVGSVLTFESKVDNQPYAYDRCVMLAGGVGWARAEYAEKQKGAVGDKVVLLGGDNYRIGMAGGSVSSVNTGSVAEELELSAVQRANPEMQKRVYNAIRALSESAQNPIKLIHDHGAGGHVNCFSELLEGLGGKIQIAKLPIGDPTLSPLEILCNESQERMGLIVSPADLPLLQQIAQREGAPCYVVGELSGDGRITFIQGDGTAVMDFPGEVLFGSSPKLTISDRVLPRELSPLEYSIESEESFGKALEAVLSLEAVACKDWLTNKVDRCVGGLVAQQQNVGPLHLPLSNVGVMALDYSGEHGVATAIGHAPVAGLIDESAGAILSVAEALTNIVWAPLSEGLSTIALSANWMWPARQAGEDARLYRAVQALSDFALSLGIAVPTGKDSLSMTMNYADGRCVKAPGTVVVSAAARTENVLGCVTPDLKPVQGSFLYYLDFSGAKENPLGGSSFAQTLGEIGDRVPTVVDVKRFATAFALIQELIRSEVILAGHDISSGGLIAALCEMSFAGNIGLELKLNYSGRELVECLFCEKPGVVLQVRSEDAQRLLKSAEAKGLSLSFLGEVRGTQIKLHSGEFSYAKPVSELRRVWFKTSYLLDSKQTKPELAKERYEKFDQHPLRYVFPQNYCGDRSVQLSTAKTKRFVAAVVRDQGSNGERELAMCLDAAGFTVRDVTTSDLMEGREDLTKVNFVAFPGGFSKSDVTGAGRGWAAVFRYHQRVKQVVHDFFSRKDTLAIGVCNGCQLMVVHDLINPGHAQKMRMEFNESHKFESTFVNVRVQPTNNVLLKPLIGCQLGVWVAHGEGRFVLPEESGETAYDIPLKYVTADYPANPNGADFNAAAVSSPDGRFLAIMPHIERSLFAWNWPYRGEFQFEVSPWILAFHAARQWLERC